MGIRFGHLRQLLVGDMCLDNFCNFGEMLDRYRSWVLYIVIAYLFLGVSFLQMTDWALKKHKELKKEFDGKNGKLLYPR